MCLVVHSIRVGVVIPSDIEEMEDFPSRVIGSKLRRLNTLLQAGGIASYLGIAGEGARDTIGSYTYSSLALLDVDIEDCPFDSGADQREIVRLTLSIAGLYAIQHSAGPLVASAYQTWA
jgi:hypothetical protein